jgi:FkbM family methyltransferase
MTETSNSVQSRSLKRTLVATGALVALGGLLLAGALSDPARRLDLQFRLGTWLARFTQVVELQIPQVPGLRMILNPDDSGLTYILQRDHQWEPTETRWVTRLLQPGDTFIDVGANIGYYTVLASRLVGSSGRVVAFEPDPVAASFLRKNLLLNAIDGAVVEQKAVSDENGTIQLYLAPENKGDHRTIPTEEARETIDVEAVRLDDYASSLGGRIDMVKVDTQGAEGFILRGMEGVIENNPELTLILEFWPAVLAENFDVAAIVGQLREQDFVFFNLGPGNTLVDDIPLVSDALMEYWLSPSTLKNKKWFTNLLLVRGREKLTGPSRALADAQRTLRDEWMKLVPEQLIWEKQQMEELGRDSPTRAALPHELEAVLTKPAGRRVGMDFLVIGKYFRAATPLLAAEREELALAEREITRLTAELLSPSKR